MAVIVESERLTCRFCGGSFVDPRPLRLFTTEPVPAFCPSCERGKVILDEDCFLGKKGEMVVFRDIRPLVRHHDSRRKPREASRG